MRTSWSRLVAMLITGLLMVPAVYAALRAHDVFFVDEPDPATVVQSAHVAMFWRLATGGYAAAVVAVLGLIAAQRDLVRTVRALSALVFVVAAMIGIQGLLLP
jgi:hypothetical protein